MDKDSFVDLLKTFKKRASGLAKNCRDASGKQVQSAKLLADLEGFATQWFDEIEPVLRGAYSLDEDVLLRYREPLGKILELIGGRPSKSMVQTTLGSIAASIHVDILLMLA